MAKYEYAGGQRIAQRQGGVLTYLHGDHLGSASLATNASGAKITNSDTRYYPYGVTRPGLAGTGLPTDRRFTGQREEASLGFYDYGARPYDPALGRFLQADTLVPEPGNPQSLNRYAYVLGNPLYYVDPSGHRPCGPYCDVSEMSEDGSPSPPSVPPQGLLAPLQPDPPTGRPPVVDWLVQPFRHIWPRVKFYESGVSYSTMFSDIEIEWGIQEEAILLTESPFLISPSATRVYVPSGMLWLETDSLPPGKVTLGSISAQLRGSYRGVSVQVQSVGRVMMSVTDSPGVLRVGTGVELPIIAQGERIGSVRKIPYVRVSTNVYGNRAAALAVEAGVPIAVWKLWPILAPAGGASELLRRAETW